MWIYLICAAIAWFMLKRYLSKLEIGGYGKRSVFITGCDTGFGQMLAVRLDDMGFHVFAGCLTESGMESLRKLSSKRLDAVQIDVTKEESIRNCVEEVKKKLPLNSGLWAIVNNAGRVGGFGPTTWLTRKDYDDTLAVNLYGVIFVTQAFQPLILAEKGRIVNMSSVMGRFAFGEASYCVSKFGVEAFSDVLRQELYGSGVSVHVIEPGFFRTTLLDEDRITPHVRAKLESLPQHIKETLPANIEEQMLKGMDDVRAMTSPDTHHVVDAYVHALTAKYPKPRYLVGTDAKFKFWLLMHLPECISDYIISPARPKRA